MSNEPRPMRTYTNLSTLEVENAIRALHEIRAQLASSANSALLDRGNPFNDVPQQPNTPQIVSLIVSHNSRLRCLIKNYNKISETGMPNVIFRFKNCAILKLVLKKKLEDNTVTFKITLEYNGEIDETEKKSYIYYEKEMISTWKEITGNITKDNINDIGLDEKIFDKIINNSTEYVFYMVRHGQGTHNEKKFIYKKRWNQLTVPDTNLTELGEKQAIKAGDALYYILQQHHRNIVDNNRFKLKNSGIGIYESNVDYLQLFVSDLRRTHQTMVNLLKGVMKGEKNNRNLYLHQLNQQSNQQSPSYNSPQALVLPCSHELEFDKKDGICDANQSFSQKLASENRTCCITGYNNNNIVPNKSCKLKVGDIENCSEVKIPLTTDNSTNPKLNIDWLQYAKFYNYDFSDRAFRYMRSTGPNCSNISMIAHAIAIINNISLEYKKPEPPAQPIAQPSRKKTLRQRIGSYFGHALNKTKKLLRGKSDTGNGFVGNYVNAVLKNGVLN